MQKKYTMLKVSTRKKAITLIINKARSNPTTFAVYWFKIVLVTIIKLKR